MLRGTTLFDGVRRPLVSLKDYPITVDFRPNLLGVLRRSLGSSGRSYLPQSASARTLRRLSVCFSNFTDFFPVIAFIYLIYEYIYCIVFFLFCQRFPCIFIRKLLQIHLNRIHPAELVGKFAPLYTREDIVQLLRYLADFPAVYLVFRFAVS